VFADLLVERISSFAELTSLQINQLDEHFHLLNRWNKVLNLTAIRDEAAIVERHYGESLFLAKYLPPGPLSIADLGSGAGFPGIPVAIQRPECSVALIEAHQRKSVFLMEATRGLPNARVVAKRVEELAETFEWIISRGVNCIEIGQTLRKLAGNLALLAGDQNPTSDFAWNKIKLPWGSHRFLWIHSST
jgi:16S rRNA (guanine527-N7)-methyltransferase